MSIFPSSAKNININPFPDAPKKAVAVVANQQATPEQVLMSSEGYKDLSQRVMVAISRWYEGDFDITFPINKHITDAAWILLDTQLRARGWSCEIGHIRFKLQDDVRVVEPFDPLHDECKNNYIAVGCKDPTTTIRGKQ